MPVAVQLLSGVSCPTRRSCLAVGVGAGGPAVITGLGTSQWRSGRL